MADLADFAADITRRSRYARDHNNGQPDPAWSTGERLFVALVTGDMAELEYEQYTVEEAKRRLAGELAAVYGYTGDVDVWLAGIREALEMADHPAEIELAHFKSELRAWAQGVCTAQAAVELLIWHDGWLRRESFRRACVDTGHGLARIRWDDARAYADKVTRGGLDAPRASTSEAAILDLAVAIGEDRFRLGNMGSAHRRAVVAAMAQAVGLPG